MKTIEFGFIDYVECDKHTNRIFAEVTTFNGHLVVEFKIHLFDDEYHSYYNVRPIEKYIGGNETFERVCKLMREEDYNGLMAI